MVGINRDGARGSKSKHGRPIPPGRLPKDQATQWRRRIIQTVGKATGLTAPQLAQILGTPERTVRRDLRETPDAYADGITSHHDQADDDAPTTFATSDASKRGRLTRPEIADLQREYRRNPDKDVSDFLARIAEPDAGI